MTFIPEDLKAFLGIAADKEINSLEDFKEVFTSEFTRNSAIFNDEGIKKRISGAAFSKISRAQKEIAKEFGLDYKTSEIEGMQLEDFYKDSLTKLKEDYEAKMEEIAKPAGESNEEIDKLKKQLEKEKNEKLQFKTANETVLKEFEDFKKNKENEIITSQIENEKSKWFQEAGLSSLKEVEREGIESILSKQYSFSVNENKEYIVTTKDGKLIENPNVTGKFLTPLELIKQKALEKELIGSNPHGKQPVKTQVTTPKVVDVPENTGRRQAVAKPFGVL